MTANASFRRTSTLVAAAALTALALSACSNSEKASTETSATSPASATQTPPSEPTPSPGASEGTALDGKTFTATEVTGHELVEGTSLTITFADGGVSAQAGCNNLFGAYSYDQVTLDVPMMASTMMACEPELMTQDQWLTGFLSASPDATLAADSLTLASGDVTIVLNQD